MLVLSLEYRASKISASEEGARAGTRVGGREGRKEKGKEKH